MTDWILAAALAYLAEGFSVTSLLPESKLPTVHWADFQERLPSVDELGRWFGKGNNLGLVMGAVSDKAFAHNPPSIAIAGGVRMWIVGSIMKAAGAGGGDLLYWAPIVFFAGVILQVLWLFLHR